MTELLVWRDRLRLFYRDYEKLLCPVWKFFLSLFIILYMNQMLGYDKQLKSVPLVILLSLISAFAPTQIFMIIMAGFALMHVYALASLLAVLVLGVFFVLFLLFERFTPSYGYVVVIMPVAMSCHIPLLPVLLIGLTAEPAAIIASSCGVIIYFLFRALKTSMLASTTMETSLEGMMVSYQNVMDIFLNDKEMFLYLLAIILVVLVVYFIRIEMIPHAFQIAILVGTVLFLTVILIGDLVLKIDSSPILLLIGSVVSGILAVVIQFWLLPLDYSRIETLQFDDDDYYYYVRAVPKMQVAAPKKQVKRINVQKITNDTVDLQKMVYQDLKQEELQEEKSDGLKERSFERIHQRR